MKESHGNSKRQVGAKDTLDLFSWAFENRTMTGTFASVHEKLACLSTRCIFAFWNVWPFLIVFMMISFSLGLTHTGELLPGGVLGGLLMYAVLGLCLASPLLIQHKGKFARRRFSLAHRPEVC
ncbi:putative transmembrane protein [Toxoplasma gondii FOU]|uniref:Putative transmembrane protein n=1 Tax=Toxoplasma gondii FOU TaxID=943167 RepID=A0A086L0L3_TOXGO|nr:putative transmembrane protein [Toxoplasma gondii FOU]